ncbi:MAG: hypothetical protein ACRCX2_10285 [Paraclostridium sp.]
MQVFSKLLMMQISICIAVAFSLKYDLIPSLLGKILFSINTVSILATLGMALFLNITL